MPHVLSSARRLRLLTTSAVAAALLVPSGASARTLDLQHELTSATDVSTQSDGVVGPGDTIAIDESISSFGTQPITGLTGTLSAQGTEGTVTQASSGYPDLSFGQSATNTTPFRAIVGSGVVCGQNVGFVLDLGTGNDTATIPVTVPTGEALPAVAYAPPQRVIAVADNGTVESTFEVAQSGRIKDAQIHIGRLNHSYVSDLQLSIKAPDGTVVKLIENRGGSGHDLVDTTFSAAAGRSIVSAQAPFTGTFRPEGDLGDLTGHQQQGTWTLSIRDTRPADGGTLESWGADIAKADCTPRAVASFAAAPDQVEPGAAVSFDASASRIPGTGVTRYEWDLDGNGSYETDRGPEPTVSHVFPVRGNVPVGLRITGAPGTQATTTRAIPVTQAPVASFTSTPAAPLSGETVSFDAAASHDVESDGTIVRYEWDLDGDGSFETDRGTQVTAQRSYVQPGTVQVRLRVTDDNGATTTVGQPVTIDNRPPVAGLAVPAPAVVGTTATFSAASSTDPDGTVVRYEWDLDGDPATFELDTGSVPTAQRTFTAAGRYDARVRVTDNAGDSDVRAVPLVITTRPTARIVVTPKPSRPNQVVTLDASSSTDADGTVATFAWDLDGNGSYETSTGATPTVARPFTLGDHPVGVRVTDNDGATGGETATVSAVNALPVAAITASANPATAGSTVRFDASGSSDSDGTVARFDWDLDGNGSFETTSSGVPTISYSYPNPGTIVVRVRAVDNDGGANIKSLTLTVAAPAASGGTGDGGGSGSGPAPATTPTTSGAPAAGDPAAAPAQGAAAGSGPAPASGPAVSAGTGAPVSSALLAVLVGPSIQSTKRAATSGVRLSCHADRRASCKVTAELPATEARRLGLATKAQRAGTKSRPLRLATTTVVASGGRDAAIVLRLPAKARKVLGRARRAQIVVRGIATDGAGGKIALSRIVLLRR